MPKTTIILFSHGSLLCGASIGLNKLAQQLHHLSGLPIKVSYLNYNQPTFAEAVAEAAAEGAERIAVAPYFLAEGYFVTQKLPPLIEAAKAQFPALSFHIGHAMRAHPKLAETVLSCAQRVRSIDAWHQFWQVPPGICQHDSHCPFFEGENCSKPRRAAPPVILPPDNQQTALLALVHGSPQEESNNDMYEVLAQVRCMQKYFHVQSGFLECNEPAIPDAIEQCVEAGAKRIIGLPYFLHAGRHVAIDLPTIFEEAQKRYPKVELFLGEHLGQSMELAKVLLDIAR